MVDRPRCCANNSVSRYYIAASLAALAMRNFRTLLAGILMVSPVAGFLPMHAIEYVCPAFASIGSTGSRADGSVGGFWGSARKTEKTCGVGVKILSYGCSLILPVFQCGLDHLFYVGEVGLGSNAVAYGQYEPSPGRGGVNAALNLIPHFPTGTVDHDQHGDVPL